MGRIKWELEDLALQYLHPQEYEQIRTLIAENREEREGYISEICGAIQSEMRDAGLEGKVFGRPKHFYSIYNKMKGQGKAFTDLFDLTALRVLVDGIPDCYHVLGIVHNLWRPIPGRIKDYIAMPKPNLYQSLHTSVMGPRGKPFEIQIRTTEMNQTAEYGIAAHWRYKEGGELTKADEKLTWLRQILELRSDLKDPEEFLTSVKEDLFSDEVFVFTPRGDVLDLKRGATIIDFAYRIHSSVGHRCTGAKVNGRIVPLETTLGNGDIVEIMTTKVERPRLDWLSFVTTSGAKQRIRSWFKKQRREENIEAGREALERELDRMRLLNLAKPEYLLEIAPKLKFQSADDVLAAIGYGEKPAVSVANLLRDTYAKPLEPFVPKTHVPSAQARKRNGTGILVEGDSGMLLHLSTCCAPVPGEPIVGLVTKTRGISIHAADCPNLGGAEADRRVSVDWPGGEQSTFPVEIAIEVIDRVGLLKDVTAKMADTKTNIRNVEVRQSGKGGKIVVVHLVIDVFDVEHLQRVLGVVGRIADVIKAYRLAKGQRVKR
jgi:GTP pyrophosphokinase